MQPELVAGDARHLLDHFGHMRGRFSSIITSPPYFDLQDYGVPNQIGWGQVLADYLADVRSVFQAAADLSVDTATMWLVVSPIRRNGQLLLLPDMLLQEAQRVGWTGREIVIWEKSKALPWTKHGELRDVTEQLILLSKTPTFKFDVADLLVPEPRSVWWRRYPERYSPRGTMPTNFWRIPIPTQGSWRNGPSHACPFPYELTFRMIALVTAPGDLVLDPFAGLGSVPAMANAMGRIGYGLELSPVYVAQYRATVLASLAWWKVRQKQIAKAASRGVVFRRTILQLRLLKYARIIANTLKAKGMPIRWVRVSEKDTGDLERFKVVAAEFELVCGEGANARDILTTAESKSRQRPLSKFGVQPFFSVQFPAQAALDGCWYPSARFWGEPSSAMPISSPEPHILAPFRPDVKTVESWEGCA